MSRLLGIRPAVLQYVAVRCGNGRTVTGILNFGDMFGKLRRINGIRKWLDGWNTKRSKHDGCSGVSRANFGGAERRGTIFRGGNRGKLQVKSSANLNHPLAIIFGRIWPIGLS